MTLKQSILFDCIFYIWLGQIRDKVLTNFIGEFKGDPELRKEILGSLAKKVESTLNSTRAKQLGHLPADRDSFDPHHMLSVVQNGQKILTLDSNQDLPPNWQTIDISDFTRMGQERNELLSDIPTSEDELAFSDAGSIGSLGPTDSLSSMGSLGLTDSLGTGSLGSVDSLGHAESLNSAGSFGDEPLNDSVEDEVFNASNAAVSDTLDLTTVTTVPRVLVFTTIQLLGLLSVCVRGSVDGTFKTMTRYISLTRITVKLKSIIFRLWTQLFVLLVEFRGSWVPAAFGWLPNKCELSYHIFLLLLLGEFNHRKDQIAAEYGSSVLKLRKIKLDFELSIHQAFAPVFLLSGCFFHFRKKKMF